MDFDNHKIIEYGLNTDDYTDDYIVIVGASNSLMSQGWAYYFTKKLNSYKVINLSLGATSSSYIALVFLTHRKLLENAKYIIIEPFVNDVSFVGNKDFTRTAFITCIDYYYNLDATISKKILVLLLPTQKRIHGYYDNEVYKAHLYYASQAGATILDCHPYFASLDTGQIDAAFKDPAHLGCNFAELISDWVVNLIQGNANHNEFIHFGHQSKSRMFYVNAPTADNKVRKSTSLFSCNLVELKDKLVVEVPYDHSLIGILHWSNMNENFFKLSACGQVSYGQLKSKYLKLTSLPFNVNGSFIMENESEHTFGLAGFLFSDNIITLDSSQKLNVPSLSKNDLKYYAFHF